MKNVDPLKFWFSDRVLPKYVNWKYRAILGQSETKEQAEILLGIIKEMHGDSSGVFVDVHTIQINQNEETGPAGKRGRKEIEYTQKLQPRVKICAVETGLFGTPALRPLDGAFGKAAQNLMDRGVVQRCKAALHIGNILYGHRLTLAAPNAP